MTEDILGCDDSVGKQDDFKQRAKRRAEEWACKDAHEKSWTYEMLRDGFIEGAEWARSHLDSEGLFTVSQAQWDKHQAEVKRLREAFEKIGYGMGLYESDRIRLAQEALRGEGSKE
jgi:hypothetical protein